MSEKKRPAGKEPEVVTTEDGYTFVRQEDGTYTDGDMTFDRLEDIPMDQEQLNSYFIKKIKELEGRIDELEAEANTPTLEEAMLAHSSQMSLGLSESTMAEKRRLGRIAWGGK